MVPAIETRTIAILTGHLIDGKSDGVHDGAAIVIVGRGYSAGRRRMVLGRGGSKTPLPSTSTNTGFVRA